MCLYVIVDGLIQDAYVIYIFKVILLKTFYFNLLSEIFINIMR